MAKDPTLAKLTELKALGAGAAPEVLRAYLRDKSNAVVAKAAAVSGEAAAKILESELLAAFERMMRAPAKSDPQCLAKIAIAKALRDLDCEEPEVFFRGTRHVQMEPVYGGQVDTAVDLRATCGHALTSCANARIHEVFVALVDLLADAEARVRAEAALAIGRFEHPQSELLLRLKIRMGDEAVEVMGACFDGLLNAAPDNALGLIGPYLDDGELCFEAASALGASRAGAAFDLLLERIAGGHPHSESLVRALLPKRPYPEMRARVAEAVAANGGGLVQRTFEREFGTL